MIKNKRFWTETEILCQQLELLAEDSKEDFPETCKVSRNSTAMAKISNELFKRKCFAIVLFFHTLHDKEKVVFQEYRLALHFFQHKAGRDVRKSSFLFHLLSFVLGVAAPVSTV